MARARTPALVAAALVAISVAVSGAVVAGVLDGADAPARRESAPAAASTSTSPPEPACAPAPLAERAAAVLVVGLPGVTDPAHPLVAGVTGIGVGGVLLTDANVVVADQARALVGALRAASPRGLLVTIDEEGGRVSSTARLGPRSPSARRLGRRPPEAVRDAGRALGTTLASIDVDVALAPVADLDDGPAQGVIGDRSFGSDPAAVATAAVAFAGGLRDAGVMATAKHFPGHGGTADSHAGPASVDLDAEALRRTELVPFDALVEDGVGLVMLNHVSYSGLGPLPASLSPAAYDLLRSTGFDGVAVTDSLGMGAVNLRWPFGEAAVMAVGAGADAVLATDGNQARAMRDALVGAVVAGRVPEARLDEAVTRMLTLRGVDPTSMVCTRGVAG